MSQSYIISTFSWILFLLLVFFFFPLYKHTISESNGTILLTISKEDFDRVVKVELLREVHNTQNFLKDLLIFDMITNDEDMHNIAKYAESREYSVDDVIVAEGTEQEEGIFVVRSGKCDVVAGTFINDFFLLS